MEHEARLIFVPHRQCMYIHTMGVFSPSHYSAHDGWSSTVRFMGKESTPAEVVTSARVRQARYAHRLHERGRPECSLLTGRFLPRSAPASLVAFAATPAWHILARASVQTRCGCGRRGDYLVGASKTQRVAWMGPVDEGEATGCNLRRVGCNSRCCLQRCATELGY